MDIRDEIQLTAIEYFLHGNKKSILLIAPRVGKCRIALSILEKEGAKKVLVCYPRKDIKKSWLDEIELLGLQHLQIEYSTTLSLKRCLDEEYDYVIFDEIHEYSDNQLDVVDKLVETTSSIALTGTMTAGMEKNIAKRTGLVPCFKYTIEEAVRDGILCDYEINIHVVELDDKIPYYESKKGRKYTEAGWFKTNEFLRKKTNNPFFDNKLRNIVQNSLSKLRKTKALLRDSGDERVLIFCGTTKTADALGIPVYHSKNRNEENFIAFCEGLRDKIATINLARAGIKIVPIQRAIFNFMSGAPEPSAQSICRVLAKELWNPAKKAQIDIIISDTTHEKIRMHTALGFFDQTKIKWIN